MTAEVIGELAGGQMIRQPERHGVGYYGREGKAQGRQEAEWQGKKVVGCPGS